MVSPGLKRLFISSGILGVLIAVLAGILGMSLTFEGAQVFYRIPTGAQMLSVGVGVFWDVTCTAPVTQIDWGALAPGETANVTVYVKNTGNGPISGSISTDSWVPEGAGQYFDLTWNFGVAVLEPGRVRKTSIFLYVHPDITGINSFSFVIIITGTQA